MNSKVSEDLPEFKNHQPPVAAAATTPPISQDNNKLSSIINRRRCSASSSSSGSSSNGSSSILDKEDFSPIETNHLSHETETNVIIIGDEMANNSCIKSQPDLRKSGEQHDNSISLDINQQQQHMRQQHQQVVDAASAATATVTKGFEEVKQVELFGVKIVALTINGKERLCLAQISNTLLKEFSYNEIHNRRVALGITCIQCTPIQLEMLRRAGAMPSSSRRCGMITMREAERLCRSFLVEEQTPELPDNFYFTVAHRVNYGCKGRFIPARYISSRAKCIECFYCGEFYSPNKFIFHSHRQPHVSDCNPPDSPNINSWRKHIDLDWTLEHSQEIKYAWEDVKSLFNGGTRRRAPLNNNSNGCGSRSSATGGGAHNSGGSSAGAAVTTRTSVGNGSFREPRQQVVVDQLSNASNTVNTDQDQLIDVECDSLHNSLSSPEPQDYKLPSGNKRVSQQHQHQQRQHINWSAKSNERFCARSTNSLIHNLNNSSSTETLPNPANLPQLSSAIKRPASSQQQQQYHNHHHDQHQQQQFPSTTKRFVGCNPAAQHHNNNNNNVSINNSSPVDSNRRASSYRLNSSPIPISAATPLPLGSPHTLGDFLSLVPNRHPPGTAVGAAAATTNVGDPNLLGCSKPPASSIYPLTNSSNFIYSQLYNQLMQPQQQQLVNQQQPQQQQHTSLSINAQLALRHHLWSSLLANLQCNNAANLSYSMAANPETNHRNTPIAGGSVDSLSDLNSTTNLNHLISSQLYSAQSVNKLQLQQQQQQQQQQTVDQTALDVVYKINNSNNNNTNSTASPFPLLHKYPQPPNDTNDL